MLLLIRPDSQTLLVLERNSQNSKSSWTEYFGCKTILHNNLCRIVLDPDNLDASLKSLSVEQG